MTACNKNVRVSKIWRSAAEVSVSDGNEGRDQFEDGFESKLEGGGGTEAMARGRGKQALAHGDGKEAMARGGFPQQDVMYTGSIAEWRGLPHL